ncbi:MAG: HIT family protein [Candidatus Pacebacteria bacterium]|nr:HIT family protein [Candidatus Paceibacterota bacterium]MDD4074272.1 HIT family protein [Candidatus Paceibacterota bacterium]
MEDCIFCKIISGEIPSYKIYEDDFVFAFLDINPTSLGHTLVVPKKHNKDVFDIEEEYLKRTILISKKIAKKMKEVLDCDGVNVYNNSGASAGQIIFHFHIHVIPRKNGDMVDFKPIKVSEDDLRLICDKLKIEE